MPLPVSHALAGAAIYSAADRDGGRAGWRRLVVAVFIANAADLDLLPGMFLGDPNGFHHGATHSFFFAVAVGLMVALVLAGMNRCWPLRARLRPFVGTALMVAALWGSHVVLDLLTRDPSPPFGVPALWPVSDGRFRLPALFARADKLAGPASSYDFLASLLSSHNLRAVAFEALSMGAVVFLAQAWRRRRSSHP